MFLVFKIALGFSFSESCYHDFATAFGGIVFTESDDNVVCMLESSSM
jgi:hypothetical protein